MNTFHLCSYYHLDSKESDGISAYKNYLFWWDASWVAHHLTSCKCAGIAVDCCRLTGGLKRTVCTLYVTLELKGS